MDSKKFERLNFEYIVRFVTKDQSRIQKMRSHDKRIFEKKHEHGRSPICACINKTYVEPPMFKKRLSVITSCYVPVDGPSWYQTAISRTNQLGNRPFSGERKYDGQQMIDTVWYATNPTITTYNRINQLSDAEEILTYHRYHGSNIQNFRTSDLWPKRQTAINESLT